MNDRMLSLLGLCYRARRLIAGEDQVLKEIQKRSVRLVIVAGDASEKTKKRFTDKCKFYQIPLRIVSNRNDLGKAIGKGERVVIGIADEGFSRKLISLIDGE